MLKLWASDHSKLNEAQVLLAAVAGVNAQASKGGYQGPHPTTAEGAAATLREGFRGWRG